MAAARAILEPDVGALPSPRTRATRSLHDRYPNPRLNRSFLIWLIGLLSDANVSAWWYVVGIVIVGLFVTWIYPPWRHGVWGNVRKWRPFTTAATIERAREEGRAEAEAKAEAERVRRKPSVHAQWLIVKRKELADSWEMTNAAQRSIAHNVSIFVDATEFQVASAMDWAEVPFGSLVFFTGQPTTYGKNVGIDFVVKWENEHGESLAATVHWDAPRASYVY